MKASFITLSAVVIATMAVGCTTSSHRTSATTEVGTSIREVRTEVASAKVQVEQVRNTLHGLVDAEDEATLIRRYELFAQSVDGLEAQRQALSDRADDMRKRREDYLEEWRRGTESISDPELRQLSRERHAELSDQFGEVRQHLVEAGYAMDPVIGRLNSIETTLKYDLSRQSVDRIAKTLEDTPLAEDQLDEALSKIQQQLDELDRVAKLE